MPISDETARELVNCIQDVIWYFRGMPDRFYTSREEDIVIILGKAYSKAKAELEQTNDK